MGTKNIKCEKFTEANFNATYYAYEDLNLKHIDRDQLHNFLKSMLEV